MWRNTIGEKLVQLAAGLASLGLVVQLVARPALAEQYAKPALVVVKDSAERPAAFEATGLPAEILTDEAAWANALSVYVNCRDAGHDAPAILGSHSVMGDVLRFTPRYALRPGLAYRVVIRPPRSSPITREIEVPELPKGAPPRVVGVYPSGEVLPENQLRFYLHFSAPMRRGEVYRHLSLLDQDGQPLELPFLEIGEELWDTTGERLTVLFDPGRIKRGLVPRETAGPVLENGRRYTLVIDPAWQDAAGQSLVAKFEKKFAVGPPLETSIDPKDWKLTLPAAGTRAPLIVDFGRPLDRALAERLLTIEDHTGAPVSGAAATSDYERRWQFTPTHPWPAGKYDLAADAALEDVAGNQLGQAFEVDVFREVERKTERKKTWIPFELRKPPSSFRPTIKPAARTQVSATAPPNVVILLSDDQAWTDYGFMGHPRIKTPHLDKFASESVVFTRGYVPTSLCRASLMSLITGLYPRHHLITGNDPPKGTDRKEMLKHVRRVATLPKLLGEKGYVSLQTGKWWEGNFADGGFTSGMTHGDPARGGRHGDLGLKIGREGLKPIDDFLDTHPGKPFFLWYAPIMPHTPHTPPERLLAKYRDQTDSLFLAKYWAMCEWWDETCGELLANLDRRGLAENTIVVYLADNGWIQNPTGNNFAPRSKRSPYEGGIRQPIMIRWPARLHPKRDESSLVSSIDLVPTILAACGIEATREMRGGNLLDVAAGRATSHPVVFGEIYEHDVVDLDRAEPGLLHRWCVAGEWKLIESADGKTRELYNVAADPHEKNDLAAAQPELAGELSAKIKAAW
ncbi:MAG: sulfatase-like hydrolase/transferase [Pirellulaceae bacterium]|nr:sulfatase-like hydrolase/transferase [Pirellulaceae bacterium]